MTRYRKTFGKWGERLAHDYLVQRGYTILELNYHTPYGELDLVALKDGMVIFVEVKTRSSKKYGLPEDAITRSKQAHLLDAATYFIQHHPDLGGNWQVDVIAIERNSPNLPAHITHFENAITR